MSTKDFKVLLLQQIITIYGNHSLATVIYLNGKISAVCISSGNHLKSRSVF